MKLDGNGYPKDCCVCGKPVSATSGISRHEHDHLLGVKRSWHDVCDPARGARPVAV